MLLLHNKSPPNYLGQKSESGLGWWFWFLVSWEDAASCWLRLQSAKGLLGPEASLPRWFPHGRLSAPRLGVDPVPLDVGGLHRAVLVCCGHSSWLPPEKVTLCTNTDNYSAPFDLVWELVCV